MKAYRFRFEKVLKTKQVIIDDLATKTARAQKILLMEKRKLETFENRRSECLDRLAALQTGALDAREIQRSHRYLHQLHGVVSKQVDLVKEIGIRVEALRNLLIETQKEKKILEKLDEKEREAFIREYLRKEQAVLDEVCINKYAQQNAHYHAPLPQRS